MAKKSLPRLKEGDIVVWNNPEEHVSYTPGPYKIMTIRGDSVYLRCLNGEKVYFGRTPLEHQGVGLYDIRVDTFLNAARKANLEESDEKA